MTTRSTIAAAMMAFAFFATDATPEPVTITISGTIESVDDPEGILDGSVQPSGTFQYTYTIDSAAVDSNSDPTVGDYAHSSDPFGARITAGNYTFATRSGGSFLLEVVNRSSDHYLWHSYENDPLSEQLLVE